MPTRPGWLPCAVRFAASGRADQTPVAVCLGSDWRLVSLLREELVASPDPADPPTRRYQVRCQDGECLELSRPPGGQWRFRKI